MLSVIESCSCWEKAAAAALAVAVVEVVVGLMREVEWWRLWE